MREEDVPAQQPQAEEEARLSTPHANPRRPSGDPASSLEGPQPPVGLIWRLRDRASFRALATGTRRHRGVLAVTCARLDDHAPPRVGYAVGRLVGGAVRRNRLRRQLRAAVHDEATEFEPSCAYLLSASPRAVDVPYEELRLTLREILTTLRAECSR
jgi:ribonuclease P protein component